MSFRKKLHDIIFYADTPAGKWFDIILIIAIIMSVINVMLDSVSSISSEISDYLIFFEWLFTILFTLEYITRIYISEKPIRYIFSFFGVVDLLSILPTFFGILIPNTKYLSVIRIMRVIRIFRILKLVKYLGESQVLMDGLIASRRKISVFLIAVIAIVTIIGSVMYIIEGPENGFDSIPHSIYWAIVTLTTVGYGDIYPSTALGQFLASVVMILGYGIIAVPTGIITSELSKTQTNKDNQTQESKNNIKIICSNCKNDNILEGDLFCSKCGTKL
jgi:voltage-gated potassium channel